MEEDADTGTTIIVTRVTGPASSFNYVVQGARPRRKEVTPH